MRTGQPTATQLGVAIVLLLFVASPAVAEYQVEVSLVDTGFYYYYDLGIDPAGHAHAYIDETGIDRLYYTNNVSGEWIEPEFVHTTSDWGSINVSGAVDSSGFSHIAFDGEDWWAVDSFFHATNKTGDWVCNEVRSGMRWYALDLGPTPHELPRVAYYDNYSGLNYGTMHLDGTWTHENVDNSGDVTRYAGRYPDLIVDENDHGHISYYYYVDKDIRYATNNSGSWEWEVVVSDPTIDPKSYITLDPNGVVLVNYRANNRVWLAKRRATGWELIPVTPAGNYGQTDVKADADGRAFVVYNDAGRNKLVLAVEAPLGFVYYEIFDAAAGGDGPILQIQGDWFHVLTWKRSTDEVFYLRGRVPIPGDFDGDGDVDLSDLAFLLADYGCTGGNCVGDIDGDGDTDLADLATLLANYGTTP